MYGYINQLTHRLVARHLFMLVQIFSRNLLYFSFGKFVRCTDSGLAVVLALAN